MEAKGGDGGGRFGGDFKAGGAQAKPAGAQSKGAGAQEQKAGGLGSAGALPSTGASRARILQQQRELQKRKRAQKLGAEMAGVRSTVQATPALKQYSSPVKANVGGGGGHGEFAGGEFKSEFGDNRVDEVQTFSGFERQDRELGAAALEAADAEVLDDLARDRTRGRDEEGYANGHRRSPPRRDERDDRDRDRARRDRRDREDDRDRDRRDDHDRDRDRDRVRGDRYRSRDYDRPRESDDGRYRGRGGGGYEDGRDGRRGGYDEHRHDRRSGYDDDRGGRGGFDERRGGGGYGTGDGYDDRRGRGGGGRPQDRPPQHGRGGGDDGWDDDEGAGEEDAYGEDEEDAAGSGARGMVPYADAVEEGADTGEGGALEDDDGFEDGSAVAPVPMGSPARSAGGAFAEDGEGGGGGGGAAYGEHGEPYEHDFGDMKSFLLSPVPRRAGIVQCYIRRSRTHGGSKMYPEYCLYLKQGDRFLLCSKKRAKNKTSNYLVSMQRGDMDRHGPNYLGKLRSNFVGTEFTVYDSGGNPKDAAVYTGQQAARQELGVATYAANVLGSRGPRKMQCCVPAVDPESNEREEWRPPQRGAMAKMFKKKNMEGLVPLINKPPRWNDQVGAYVLNFNGRVTMASVKNFQLVTPHD
eukprot:g6575.t1